MPELNTTLQQQLDESTPKGQIGYGMPIAPTAAFDIADPAPDLGTETFLHPVKAFNDLITAIRENTAMVDLLLKQSLKERTFVDRMAMIGATVGFPIGYHERKYVYVFPFANVTLNFSSGGSVAVTANKWTNLSPPRGTIVTVNGGSDSAPTAILFRACDVVMN